MHRKQLYRLKGVVVWAGLAWCVLTGTPGHAQISGTGAGLEGLKLGQVLTEDSLIRITYTIPYSGYVELQLMTANGDPLALTTFVQEPGEHEATLHRGRLVMGQTYRYRLTYKGRTYGGKFVNEF